MLPGRLQRSDVERVMVQVGHALGLPASRVQTLLAMIQRTAPSDWTDPSREPICFEEQQQVARALGKTARSVRTDEAILERVGLLAKTCGADGSRGSFAGGRLRQGISFSPLIERLPELLELAEDLRGRRQQHQILRRKISAARRILKRALEELEAISPVEPAQVDALQAYADLPRRYDRLNLGELSALLETVDNLTHNALSALDLSQQTSGVPEPEFRPHIQDTTKERSVFCNGPSVDMRPSGKPDDIRPSEDGPPSGAPSCSEQKGRAGDRGHKPEFLESFAPRQIYAAATENMRLYLEAVKGDRPLPNQLDFIRAAELMLPELGIHPAAWQEACDVLGDLAAALAVVVIDAGQYRPVRPIHSPGGTLRAFVRRARVGQLNLTGSLIGIIERSRQCSA